MWTKSCRLSPGPVGVEGLLDVVAAGLVTTADTEVVAAAVTAVDTGVVAVGHLDTGPGCVESLLEVVAAASTGRVAAHFTDILGADLEVTAFCSPTLTTDFSATDPDRDSVFALPGALIGLQAP